MLRQVRESMLCQILHVHVASDTHKIQSSDSSDDVGRYDVALFFTFCQTKHHFRWCDKGIVDMSIVMVFNQGEESKLCQTMIHISNVNKEPPSWNSCGSFPNLVFFFLITRNMEKKYFKLSKMAALCLP